MFDLVEEDLSKRETNEKDTAIPVVDAVVYTMPEKFRKTVKSSNGKFIIIIVGVVVFLAITGTVVFLILSQTKKPPINEVTPPEQTQPIQEGAATSTEPVGEPLEPPLSEATTTPPTLEEQPQPTPEQPQEPTQPVTEGPVPGIDSDGDGLTDVEERLFNTNAQVQDTDGDQFSDGEEFSNLYDPIRPEGARLEVSGLVSPFTNKTFSYSFYYPSSWSSRAVNQSDKEVIVSSATGEFVSIAVQDNPSQLSAIDWYVSFVDPSADTGTLKTLSLNNWSAVLSPDNRRAYLVKVDSTGAIIAPYIYILHYNPNTSVEVQFQSTYMMMIKSFVFTDLSFVR